MSSVPTVYFDQLNKWAEDNTNFPQRTTVTGFKGISTIFKVSEVSMFLYGT